MNPTNDSQKTDITAYTAIEELGLSVQAFNALKRAGIKRKA